MRLAPRRWTLMKLLPGQQSVAAKLSGSGGWSSSRPRAGFGHCGLWVCCCCRCWPSAATPRCQGSPARMQPGRAACPDGAFGWGRSALRVAAVGPQEVVAGPQNQHEPFYVVPSHAAHNGDGRDVHGTEVRVQRASKASHQCWLMARLGMVPSLARGHCSGGLQKLRPGETCSVAKGRCSAFRAPSVPIHLSGCASHLPILSRRMP
mmetsp:Transcript_107580/g.299676  ORF Transcript_107580/g.299676 Transcript_107580/m.299676 type:complete len:206 (-) Transcript_107580:121-738(-)